MKYYIVHRTHYEYNEPVLLCHNIAHLLPRNYERQICNRAKLVVDPSPAVTNDWEDTFGNRCTYFALQDAHERLTVTAVSEVDVRPPQGGASADLPWEKVIEILREGSDPLVLEARRFILESPFIGSNPEFAAYAAPSFATGRPIIEAVNDLMRRIHEEFTYDPTFSTIATPITDVLAHRKGVCQDFGHLAIGCLRAQGLAARYVSGYLETVPPPGKPKLRGADASHAWFSVFVPGTGWVDFDPTNNQIPIERHIVIAWGRDYGDVTPLKGVIYGGGSHSIEVSVDVKPIKGQTFEANGETA